MKRARASGRGGGRQGAVSASFDQLDVRAMERARKARDPRFDGRFYLGVTSTGVYCRPICPAQPPRSRNVRFFPSAAAAADAGFRPCLRCRPESAPGTPLSRGTASTVARAVRLIDAGALDEAGVDALAARLGLGARQLGRLCVAQLGASPVQLAQTRRLHLALKLLSESQLPVAVIAQAAGYRSVRRFNEAVADTFGKPPRQLHARRVRGAAAPGAPARLRSASRSGTVARAVAVANSHSAARRGHSSMRHGSGAAWLPLQLAYRPPLAWPELCAFFGDRGLAGLEHAHGARYTRVVALHGTQALLRIEPSAQRNRIALQVCATDLGVLPVLVARVRRVFDLDADPLSIERDLHADPMLAPQLRATPGLRTPGAFDGFELAVRAVLGQAISVQAARTLATRLLQRHGEPLDHALRAALQGDVSTHAAPPLLTHAFPSAERLCNARLDSLGIPAARASAIRTLARAVHDESLALDGSLSLQALLDALCALPGVGPWTANYIAMRLGAYPDAFPSGDLGLQVGAALCLGRENSTRLSAAELEDLAERWRPWRAYAAMHLWHAYGKRQAARATRTARRRRAAIRDATECS